MSDTGVVTFVYLDWLAVYPEFVTVLEPAATNYFAMATMYCDNNASSPILDTTKRTMILYALTSHITSLLATVGGVTPSPLVGRINTATEGSVSVGTDLPTTPNAAWFTQTKYGMLAWQALAPYRTAIYIAPPQTAYGQMWPFSSGGWSWPR